MEFTWIVPVIIILAGAAYAISTRYFSHRERLAKLQNRDASTEL